MVSRLSRIAAGAALAVACLTVAPSAALAGDVAAAEALFQEGLAAMKRNDYAVACDAFAASNKADPSPGTQINLAVCFEKQKKWASAWTWYRSAFGLAQQRGQKEREQLAEESANRLQPMLHYVVVSVSEPLDDLVVRRDGNEVTIAVAGKPVPLPVDPGEHTLEVSARGKKPWTHKFTVADNPQTDRIEVPKLEDDVNAAGGGGGDARAGAGGEAGGIVVVPTSGGNGQRIAGIAVAGVGLLSAVGSVVAFVLAKDQESKRDGVYERAAVVRVSQLEEHRKSAKTFHDAAVGNQLIAFSLAGGAAVLVGVGAFLYFTAPKSAKTVGKYILPIVGPNRAGLGLGGSF